MLECLKTHRTCPNPDREGERRGRGRKERGGREREGGGREEGRKDGEDTCIWKPS